METGQAKETDGTALIIHPKGGCFTFFKEDGEKERHFIAFPPVKNRVKDKLASTILYYNKYCSKSIVLLEDIFEEDIQTKQAKINRFYWKFGEETKPKFHKSGTISYSSLNGHCKIKVNPNKFIFCVEYLQMLNSKITDWVTEESQSGKKTKVMRLCNKYTTIKQYFSIHQIPECFMFPIMIIWRFLEQKKQISTISPIYSDDFEIPNFDEDPNKPESGSFAIGSKYYKQCTKDEYSTAVPENMILLKITNKAKTLEETSDSVVSSSFDSKDTTVWEKDDISPACLPIMPNATLVWTPEATYRRINNEIIQVFIHADKTILIARNNGEYFDQYIENNLETGILRTFTKNSVPLIITNGKCKYDIKPIINTCIEIYQNFSDSSKEVNSNPVSNWLSEIDSNSEIVIDEQIAEGCGHFIAYKNGSIKIKFEDRTHLRMMRGSPLVKIITFLGTELKFNYEEPMEFNKFMTSEERESLPCYLKTALQYLEWVYMTPEQRFEKERAELIIQHRIQNSLE